MRSHNNSSVRIALISAYILFLEMLLIRWVSAEIRIFAYVNNLALLACFIGLGAGMFYSGRKTHPFLPWILLSLLIVMVRAIPFVTISDLLSGLSNSNYWDALGVVPQAAALAKGTLLTLCMFTMIAAVFFPLGQMLGQMFAAGSNTIALYSLNIFGSIAGIIFFGGLSYLYAPPWVWLVAAAALWLPFVPREKFALSAHAGLLIFCLLMALPFENGARTVWSPYQKLDAYPSRHGNGYSLTVNNVGYMQLIDISQPFISRNFSDLQKARRYNQYEFPYLLAKDAKDVLIVGAGGGNDAAGALRHNVASIDAVEIDPGVYRLGRLLHPEKPYQDSRVHIHIDDARAFFKRAKKQYDVISFGLLDSHTLASSYNNIRLDHYVYTLESFREARKLLKPGGVMTVIF